MASQIHFNFVDVMGSIVSYREVCSEIVEINVYGSPGFHSSAY